MANPARIKGTVYETELLPKIKAIFGPQVERAPLKGIHDSGDFAGVPLPVEAKNTKTLQIPEWARRLNLVSETYFPFTDLEWVLFWSGGDRRKLSSPGELMVVPGDFGRLLLARWQTPFVIEEIHLAGTEASLATV